DQTRPNLLIFIHKGGHIVGYLLVRVAFPQRIQDLPFLPGRKDYFDARLVHNFQPVLLTDVWISPLNRHKYPLSSDPETAVLVVPDLPCARIMEGREYRLCVLTGNEGHQLGQRILTWEQDT